MRSFALLLFLWAQAAAGQPLPEIASGWQPKQAVYAERFMVVAAHPLASEAGHAVLALGGSALDAAIAVQMVLGLVEPQSSGPGGGAFLLHWSASERRLRTYDGRETAPAAARADRFVDAEGRPLAFFEAVVGGASVGVPGVLRMLELAHRHHGKRPWAQLFQHAIIAAEEGYAMSPRLHALLKAERYLADDAAARAIFYGSDGHPKPVGTRIFNPAYGETMRSLAQDGAGALYRGAIASEIVRAVRSHATPGDLTAEDLAAYRPIEREPVCGPYRVWRVCSMGPPSAGGIALLQILGLLERAGFERAVPHSAQAVHLFSEAGRLAFADRARYGADPDFIPVPVQKLLSARYLDARAGLIGERSLRIAPAGDAESTGTSHFSIVDGEGNVVAMTSTIENAFGSRIMVGGFLLNNQLTDFAFEPRRGGALAANRVEPGKRPRSSMAPTVVFAPEGTVRLALGSPGGPAIINYVAKTLVGVLDWGLDIQSAIEVPNHGSRNGPTDLERGSAYEALEPELRARHHVVQALPLVSGVHAIERIPGGWRGGADPRREGVALGR
jgi:gamma-glutamyltranspeptidase / glutathione hydrolase